MTATRKSYSTTTLLFLFLHYRLTVSTVDVTVTPIEESVVEEHPFPLTTMPNVPTFEISSTSSERTTVSDILNEADPANSSVEVKNEVTQTEKELTYRTEWDTLNACNQTNGRLLRVPDISNCTNYYEICTDQDSLSTSQIHKLLSNLTMVKSCKNGTLFDSISTQCRVKGAAYCGPYKCAALDGFFEDPTSSYSFIHCIDGVPNRKSCEPKGTIFLNETKVCMWALDDLPLGLQFLREFIWLVKFTEPTISDYPYLNSTDGFIKIGVVAVLVPLLYFLAILVWYKQFHRQARNRLGASRYSSSNTEGLNHCYYRRPSRNSAVADFHPMSHHQSTSNSSNPLSDSYFVTSQF